MWISSFLKDLKWYVLASTLFFFGTVVIGYLFGQLSQSNPADIIRELDTAFGWLKDLTPFRLFLVIFINNSVKALAVILLGIGLGIVPVGFVLLNGYIIGILMYSVVQLKGPGFFVLAILPHGIIEIPAALISVSIGLKLGWNLIRVIKGEDINLKKDLIEGVRFYSFIILPMMLIAAFVEVYVTVAIVR